MFSNKEVSQIDKGHENIPRNLCHLLPYQQLLCSAGVLIFTGLFLAASYLSKAVSNTNLKESGLNCKVLVCRYVMEC